MKTLIKNAKIVNENKIVKTDILLEDDLILKISDQISDDADKIINAEGQYLLPGVIDDQVHFREPGLTHKGNIATESKAAIAGGTTSFIEQPNTVPNAVTQALLEDKYQIAKTNSYANYSFSMGGTNDNLDEVLKTNPKNVAAVKLFLGSSTGNMLVDNPEVLEHIFSKVKMPICVHCEDEATIRKNTEKYKAEYGDDIPVKFHHLIRSEEACYLSSSMAVRLAKKHNTRLHILHISTAKELELFDNTIPLAQKRITAEACVHHLWFSEEQYKEKGTFIKWNPAVKKASDRDAIMQGVLDNKIDIIATDHAPHTIEEKENSYFKAPSGGPLVQHALLAMLEKAAQGKISKERVVEKMAHAPAILFEVEDRGFIREGYYADLVIVDPTSNYEVTKSNILYKCGWSPFEGVNFSHSIDTTIVNGNIVYQNEKIIEGTNGKRLLFNR